MARQLRIHFRQPLFSILCAACCVVAMSMTPPLLALSRDNLRFYLPFESSLPPTIAQNSTGIAYTAGSEKDVQFVSGKRGMALRVKEGLGLQYASPGMFAPKEGTISAWVRPIGWHKGDGLNHSFLRICGDSVCFLLYKFYPGNTWVYLEGKGKTGVVGSYWDEWDESQWTFLAFTFKPGEQAFYINSQLQGRRTEDMIEPEFTKSWILQITAPNDFDDLMVFDRALTEEEVQAVYRANQVERVH